MLSRILLLSIYKHLHFKKNNTCILFHCCRVDQGWKVIGMCYKNQSKSRWMKWRMQLKEPIARSNQVQSQEYKASIISALETHDKPMNSQPYNLMVLIIVHQECKHYTHVNKTVMWLKKELVEEKFTHVMMRIAAFDPKRFQICHIQSFLSSPLVICKNGLPIIFSLTLCAIKATIQFCELSIQNNFIDRECA